MVTGLPSCGQTGRNQDLGWATEAFLARNIKDIMAVFTLSQIKSGCRIGVIKHDEVQIETPMCMLYTRAGSVPSLTRDMIDRIENLPKIVHMPLPLLVEHYEAVKEFGKGIKKFTAMDGFLVYCSVQDPAVVCPTGYNNNTGVSVWGRAGRKKMDAELCTNIIEAFKPDFCQVIADSEAGDQCTKKRLNKSFERTKRFLEKVLALKESNENSCKSVLFGTSTGGLDKEARLKSKEFLKSSDIIGTVYEGFHNFGPDTETYDFTKIKDMLSEINSSEDKKGAEGLNLWHGIMTPMNVLHAVESGIDIFDSSFPYIVTERGGALMFEYNSKKTQAMEQETEINLKDKKYSEDLTPISQTCTCYTCKHHTRSYICHLLNTSELLAGVLLNVHNFHHYFRFFEALRQSLQDNTYREFRTLIAGQYNKES